MRILIFSDVPPHVVGGAEMQAWRLARAWVRMGHDVAIAGHRVPTIEQENIQLIHLPVFYPGGRGLRGLTYFFSLSKFLLTHRKDYDLIYCRFIGEAAISISMLKKLRLVDLPLVAVPAAGGSEDKADLALLRSLPCKQKVIELLNQQCECINFISPGVEHTLLAAGLRPQSIAHIPNGVPVPDGIATGPDTCIEKLLFVGRLTHQKGLDNLFLALGLIIKNGGQCKLRLVGDGPDRSELESLAAELGLQDCITFLGEQLEAVVRDEMINAHLFVLPSRYEGMSNAALEALSYGLPCVLTACGGIDTYISPEAGWVCKADDVSSLGRTLIEAFKVTPDKWSRMSLGSRSLVQKNFSLESVAKKNIELFEALC